MKIRSPWDWRSHPASYLATGYAIVGGTWILFSDALLASLQLNTETFTYLSTIKGWIFVAVTTLALFALVRSWMTKVTASEVLISQQHQELAAALDCITVSEARYRELFEKMSEAFVLHEVVFDQSGEAIDCRFLAVNPAFELSTGLHEEEIIGKSVHEIIPEFGATWLQFYGEVAKTGRAVSTVKYSERFHRYLALHAFSPQPGQFAALFRDVTDTRLAEQRIKRQNDYLTTLYQTSLTLMNHMDLVSLLSEMLHQAENLIGATSSFVFLIDDTGEYAELKVGQGAYANLIGLRLRPGEGLAGRVWESGRPMTVSNMSQWEGRLPGIDYRDIQAILCAPLQIRGQDIGMLGLVHNSPQHIFSEEDTAVVVQFAQLAAIAIENAQLYSKAQTEIAERKQAEYRLRLINEVFRNTAEGVVITDAEATVIWVNKAFSDISGYPEDEAVGKNWGQLDPDGRNPKLQEIGRENGQGRWHGECWSRRRDGQLYPAWRTISAIRDNNGNTVHYIIVFTDISEHKRDTAQIEYLASHDLLTELPNRGLLLEYARDALLRAKRQGTGIAVMFIDIDSFKVINDAYGHGVGDGAIRMAASRIAPLVAPEHFLARMGGDEFAIVFSDLSHPETVGAVAVKVLRAFEPRWEIEGNVFHLTPSIGIAIYPADAESAETLLKHAELAMYRAKEKGKNNYQFFEPELNRRALQRITMENSLRQALVRKELTLYYQPKVNIATGRVTGVEALARWINPVLGMVSPADFIPLAEETGLIIPIGEWVLRAACRQIHKWRDMGITPFSVSVNLSARQFERPDLASTVERIIREEGVEPQALELEITESMAVRDVEYTIETLDHFKNAGIRISLDDFGTGYSSFMYLKQFSLTTLKIDQSFIQDIATDSDDAAIVTAIIDLARNLGLQVVAEGVETQIQLDFLRERHCDEMQGYLFSKPVPPEKIMAMLGPGKRRSET